MNIRLMQNFKTVNALIYFMLRYLDFHDCSFQTYFLWPENVKNGAYKIHLHSFKTFKNLLFGNLISADFHILYIHIYLYYRISLYARI